MLTLLVRDKVGVLESSGLLTSGISALIPCQSLSNSFPHNYLSGILVRIFQIVECRFRGGGLESGEVVSYLSGMLVLFLCSDI